jgi:hypothetical protein
MSRRAGISDEFEAREPKFEALGKTKSPAQETYAGLLM